MKNKYKTPESIPAYPPAFKSAVTQDFKRNGFPRPMVEARSFMGLLADLCREMDLVVVPRSEVKTQQDSQG